MPANAHWTTSINGAAEGGGTGIPLELMIDLCNTLKVAPWFCIPHQASDAYVCMYHDQGLIPLKALAFEDAVNVTLGLPIIRTSVDHGTAFDIAWKGIADVSSLVKAVELAAKLAAPAKQPA